MEGRFDFIANFTYNTFLESNIEIVRIGFGWFSRTAGFSVTKVALLIDPPKETTLHPKTKTMRVARSILAATLSSGAINEATGIMLLTNVRNAHSAAFFHATTAKLHLFPCTKAPLFGVNLSESDAAAQRSN